MSFDLHEALCAQNYAEIGLAARQSLKRVDSAASTLIFLSLKLMSDSRTRKTKLANSYEPKDGAVRCVPESWVVRRRIQPRFRELISDRD